MSPRTPRSIRACIFLFFAVITVAGLGYSPAARAQDDAPVYAGVQARDAKIEFLRAAATR